MLNESLLGKIQAPTSKFQTILISNGNGEFAGWERERVPEVFWRLGFGSWNFRDLDGRGRLNILEIRSVEFRKLSRVNIANTPDDGIINSVRRIDPNHNERRAQ